MGRIFCIVVLILLNSSNLIAQLHEDKIFAENGRIEDGFGGNVDIYDRRIIASAAHTSDRAQHCGAAYIFTLNDISSTWEQTVRLSPADLGVSHKFGSSVSIHKNDAIVGAPLADTNGYYSGAVYVFTYKDSDWEQQAKLWPSDGEREDRFGCSVSIFGDYLIAGARFDNENGFNSGSAYIFHWKNAEWIEDAHLIASDGEAGDCFGVSASINDRYAVSGAYLANSSGHESGAVYVFSRDGSNWSEHAKLIGSDIVAGNRFGQATAIGSRFIVAGAFRHDVDGNIDQGAVYVFERQGDSWYESDKLVSSDGAAHDFFGVAVSISGNQIVVGANHHDVGPNKDQGAAYLFEFDGYSWNQTLKITASDGKRRHQFADEEGLAIHRNRVIAKGSDKNGMGAAYIYELQK